MDDVCISVEHTDAHTCIYLHIRMHVSNLPSARPYLPPSPRASKCLQMSAHARASAMPPHTTGRAASKPRRGVRRSACHRAGSGAYSVHVRHRRGVPRADVRVERRRRVERLRAEVARGPRRRDALARFGADACAPKHARTHTRAHMLRARTCAQHVRASTADPSACTRIYVYLNPAGSNICVGICTIEVSYIYVYVYK